MLWQVPECFWTFQTWCALGEPSEPTCKVFVETDGCPFPGASVLALMGREAGTVHGAWIAGLLGALLRGLRRLVGDGFCALFPKLVVLRDFRTPKKLRKQGSVAHPNATANLLHNHCAFPKPENQPCSNTSNEATRVFRFRQFFTRTCLV